MKNIIIFFCVLIILSFASCKNIQNQTTDINSSIQTENTSFIDSTTENYSVPQPEQLNELTTSENNSEITIQGNSNITGSCFYGNKTNNASTYTGLEELSPYTFNLPADKTTLSKELISHSYGVAKNETAHEISISNQNFFDTNGYDAICLDTKNTEKNLYLTFDCGYENGYTAKILDTLKKYNVPAAFFCTLPQIKDNPDLISRMINEGHIVGNHSVNHPDFSLLSRDEMLNEVKGFDDYIRQYFGYSSLYFRYPQGKYSEDSLYTLNQLGYKCVFWSLAYADWDIENQKGADYAVSTVIDRIHPGAVILLHSVSPDNANGLEAIINKAMTMGYKFKSLEDLN